jgi:hypothetical protein
MKEFKIKLSISASIRTVEKELLFISFCFENSGYYEDV